MRPAFAEVPARAALAGNPSDGYGGRVLAVTLPAFRARVEVLERPAADEEPDEPLIAAAVRRFSKLVDRPLAPFAIRWSTTIPPQVGLAGSSALVIATLRALAVAFDVRLAPSTLATTALAAETEELGIAAGPQDRVVQAHGGLVAMDFDPRLGPAGAVEALDPALLPPLFVAWQRVPAEPSGTFHAELRRRHAERDPSVREGIERLGALARDARDALVEGDEERFAACLDGSFDVRAEIAPLEPAHVGMVEIARSLGAAANFAGSGGAVVGTLPPGVDPARLAEAYAAEGCDVHAPAEVDRAPVAPAQAPRRLSG